MELPNVQQTLPMAEYSLRVYRIHGRFPEQFVLYVGAEEMKMFAELMGPNRVCRFQIIHIRDLDGETLLNSPFVADKILGILTRHRDRRETIRRILTKSLHWKLENADRLSTKLLVVAGLRKLGERKAGRGNTDFPPAVRQALWPSPRLG